MENGNSASQRQPNPRRRKPSPKRVFMEAYLPVLIFIGVLILTILFIVVGCNRSRELAEERSIRESIAKESKAALKAQQKEETDRLIREAGVIAAGYDYEGAINKLDSFESGNLYENETLLEQRKKYEDLLKTLPDQGPRDALNLSVQLLIADGQQAFASKKYGKSFKNNFITTQEFRTLLEELHTNGYVLVSYSDLYVKNADGTYSEGTVKLPADKKPLVLTQTQVNYYSYMVDPNEDGIPDKGTGFATRLLYQNGAFTNEMVDASGETVTGSFDLVPILEEFIRENPDFSYRGARAILAVTGYNGIFGYRSIDLDSVKPLLEALRSTGYELAFYSYANTDYKSSTLKQVQQDIDSWAQNIAPVIGPVDLLVLPRSTDIGANNDAYSGDKFTAFRAAGFTGFIGYTTGDPWCYNGSTYTRMGRLMITAERLAKEPELYEGIFDPAKVLAEAR